MKYRIIERRKTAFLMGADNSEFGKIHPSNRTWEIETITWPPKTVGSFTSFKSAEVWAKRNKIDIGEIA